MRSRLILTICTARRRSVWRVINNSPSLCLLILSVSIRLRCPMSTFEHGSEMSFEQLMGRADDVVLQQLVGDDVVRLLRHIDPVLATPGRLRDLAKKIKTPSDLLRDNETRTLLLELLTPAAAAKLVEFLGIRANGNSYVTLTNLNIRRNSLLEERLFSFFGQSLPEESEHESIPSTYSTQANYELFQHQRLAVLE